MRSGEIWWVNLDPTIGDEIRKKRPVVLLNAGEQKSLRLAIVVPVTGWQPRWQNHPFFLAIDPEPRHGLTKKGAVDCFQLRALSHRRFVKRLGELNKEEMDQIRSAVALILDIEPEHCS